MDEIESLLRQASVSPVILVACLAQASPLAKALVAGGLCVLEVTLRSPAALPAIAAMSKVEGAIVGAGTVTNARELDAAMEAGSQFIVSPGQIGRASCRERVCQYV